jgi:hypothetical protein
MLSFERTGSPPLVENEQAAFGYWLRSVRACYEAERAYGSDVVCRLHHSELASEPKACIGRILQFLNEPFVSQCLEPLQERINSSNVPDDFEPSDEKTDGSLVDEARRLNAKVMQLQGNRPPEPEVLARLEQAFAQRASELALRLAAPTR